MSSHWTVSSRTDLNVETELELVDKDFIQLTYAS